MALEEYKGSGGTSGKETIKLFGVNAQGKPNPSKAEGYYMGSREVPDHGLVHEFKGPKGEFSMWGTAKLNRSLGDIYGKAPGCFVEVTYKGKTQVTTKSGTVYMHDFGVRWDKDNVFADDAAPLYDEAEETDLDDDRLPDEVPVSRPTAPARAATTSTAKAKELLSKR